MVLVKGNRLFCSYNCDGLQRWSNCDAFTEDAQARSTKRRGYLSVHAITAMVLVKGNWLFCADNCDGQLR